MKTEIYWFMLVMVFIQTTWSDEITDEVTITPKDIAVEVGTDSVNFTCRVQLEMTEEISEPKIYWWKNEIQPIVKNDTVVINPDKYTLYGASSPGRTHYTQTIQIHDINEDDNGTYTCSLLFALGISSSQHRSTGRLLIFLEFPQPTSYKDISYTSTTKLLSDVTNDSDNQRETLPTNFTASTKPTNDRLPSSNESSDKTIILIILFVVLAGTLFLIVLIIVLITVGKRKNKTKNEENNLNSCQHGHWLDTDNSSNGREITDEETAIDNEIEDQPYNIQDDDFDQQFEYKNSVFETVTDDLDPSYTAVNQTNAEEYERHLPKDDFIKSRDRLGDYSDPAVNPTNTEQEDHLTEPEYNSNKLALDGDSEYMSTADIEFKGVSPVPAKIPNKSKKQKVINFPAKNGDLYAHVDKSSKSMNEEQLEGSRVKEEKGTKLNENDDE